jgi:Uma2 family endonuclease
METTTKVSQEKYFKLLFGSFYKLEYYDGEVREMISFPPKHNLINGNLYGLIFPCAKQKKQIILGSQQLVSSPKSNCYLFPDITISNEDCSFIRTNKGLDALKNPEIIIEVLSDSTETNDRNEKFDCYKTISSFREYVLVSTNKKKVEVFKKINETEWLMSTYYDENDEVKINDCKILLKDIYEQTNQLP